MDDEKWFQFFTLSATLLGESHARLLKTMSWCAFTTFSRLRDDSGYWTYGLPRLEDIGEDHIRDGGIWGQPFRFEDLAHVVVPREFCYDGLVDGNFANGRRVQKIDQLSDQLRARNISHRITSIMLEIKLY
jgi:hypothetical protein